MFPALQIGPLSIQTPGLILLIGLWAGLSLAERGVSQRGETPANLNPNKLFNLALAALIAGVAGARLSYVLRYPAAFAVSPWSLISLNPGLLDAWGGAAAGGVAALIYGRRNKLQFWSTLDALTPAFAVFAVSLHLSQLASGSAFGAPADLPWSIKMWGMQRHPAQVYEGLASAVILWYVWRLGNTQFPLPAGCRFLAFLAWSAGARLFLEAFRGDSYLMAGGLRLAQVLAWVVLAGCLYGLRQIKLWTIQNR